MLRDTLMATLRPVIEGLGYVLWEIEYVPGRGHGLVRVYIDAGQPVTLDDCERVSRAVGEQLDAVDVVPGHYTLEVSSPGIERPLRTAAHFAAYVGEPVFVELKEPVEGRRRFKGPLVAAGPATIELEVDGRRHLLPVAEIRKAHLAPEA